MISIIAAVAQNGVIGNKNDLPWYLPADLKRFRELTTGHTVIMGRNTFESIMARRGSPLPDRRNIVVSKTMKPHEDYEVARSLDEAVALTDPNEESFIIGGAQIYTEAIDHVDKMYLTDIDAEIDGDTYFPEFKPDEWDYEWSQKFPADDKNQYAYTFETLTRR